MKDSRAVRLVSGKEQRLPRTFRLSLEHGSYRASAVLIVYLRHVNHRARVLVAVH